MAIIAVTNITDGTTADAADVNSQINTIVNEFNGNIDNANIKSGAAISGSKLADNSLDIGGKASDWDGWIEITDSWAYASASTVTVPTDATAKYDVGDRVKFTQTGEKHFVITAVAATTLTLHGPDGDVVANAAITGVSYSKVSTPHGMPTQGAPWWQELGRTTLTGAADTISVTSLPVRKYLKILITSQATGGNQTNILRFNSDTTDANYNRRVADNYGAGTGTANAAIFMTAGATAQDAFIVIDVSNVAAQNKLVIGEGVTDAGDGAAPNVRKFIGQWENSTDAIISVQMTNDSTGDYAIGSQIIVLGHD